MSTDFRRFSHSKAISVVNYIKESFMDLIDTNEWMSDEVKTKAKHKTLLMDVRIGFPKDLLDEELMDKWIDNVSWVTSQSLAATTLPPNQTIRISQH